MSQKILRDFMSKTLGEGEFSANAMEAELELPEAESITSLWLSNEFGIKNFFGMLDSPVHSLFIKNACSIVIEIPDLREKFKGSDIAIYADSEGNVTIKSILLSESTVIITSKFFLTIEHDLIMRFDFEDWGYVSISLDGAEIKCIEKLPF